MYTTCREKPYKVCLPFQTNCQYAKRIRNIVEETSQPNTIQGGMSGSPKWLPSFCNWAKFWIRIRCLTHIHNNCHINIADSPSLTILRMCASVKLFMYPTSNSQSVKPLYMIQISIICTVNWTSQKTLLLFKPNSLSWSSQRMFARAKYRRITTNPGSVVRIAMLTICNLQPTTRNSKLFSVSKEMAVFFWIMARQSIREKAIHFKLGWLILTMTFY